MARKVFFSFHYDKDHWRVSQIRNSWVCLPESEAQPFLDKAQWEAVKQRGDTAIRNWINNQLSGSGVTCILIGEKTAQRRWVQYELEESHKQGKGLFGIYLTGMLDNARIPGAQGKNPFDLFYIEGNGRKTYLSEIYPVYSWIADDGRSNIGNWVEKAAKAAGR